MKYLIAIVAMVIVSGYVNAEGELLGKSHGLTSEESSHMNTQLHRAINMGSLVSLR